MRAPVKQKNAFAPSRRSCTQAGTGRLRGLTPPSATRLEGLGSPPRRGPLPCRGPPATRSEPDSASPPGSPPPAHTCRLVTPRAARARPSRPCHPRRAFPARQTSRASLPGPRSNPPDARPHGARAQRHRPSGPRARSRPSRPSPRRARSLARTRTLCASA